MLFNLDPIKTLILGAAASIAIAFLAVKILGAWPRRAYGEMAGEIVIAALVLYVCLSPDAFIGKLTTVAHSVFG